jgi:hypothetical protein
VRSLQPNQEQTICVCKFHGKRHKSSLPMSMVLLCESSQLSQVSSSIRRRSHIPSPWGLCYLSSASLDWPCDNQSLSCFQINDGRILQGEKPPTLFNGANNFGVCIVRGKRQRKSLGTSKVLSFESSSVLSRSHIPSPWGLCYFSSASLDWP